MASTISFEEFAAVSPCRDAVDRRKLLFVYRALEDLAAERRAQVTDLSVLEFACGAGAITLPLARSGARVRAIDTDRRSLDALSSAAARAGFGNLSVTASDAVAFRGGERFDLVIASGVIERTADPDALLANVVHHLRPDGVVIVAAANGYGPRELSSYLSPRSLARRWSRQRDMGDDAAGSTAASRVRTRHFTPGSLVTLFHRNGLDVQRFMNSDFIFTISKTLRSNPAIGSLDTELADLVPHWMASGWYVALRRGGPAGSGVPAMTTGKRVPFPAAQSLHGAP